MAGKASVFTDPKASPTGLPFKVAQLEDSLSNRTVYEDRRRLCDLGLLREMYYKEDGTIGYRCPAEPEQAYIAKGGDPAATEGRKCLCNALIANIGHPQVQRNGDVEGVLITSGDDVADVARLLRDGRDSYTAADVIAYLDGGRAVATTFATTEQSTDAATLLDEFSTTPALYESAVHSIAWSPDGKMIASGASDQAVFLWHAETGERLGTFRGHTGGVWDVAWSPDGTRLASASLDNTVVLRKVTLSTPPAR